MSGIVPEEQGGGGVQYTSGDVTPANPVGTIPVFDDAGVITAVSDVNPLPVAATFTPSGTQNVDVVANTIGLATEATLAAIDAGIPAALGQAAMAASMPVVIASNQSAVPISGTVTVDTSLLATAANQATEIASLSVLDDWDESDRAKVNLIVGQAGIAAGTGVDGVTVPRVTLATNVALPAGTNNIGDVDVLTLPSLPAGTNNIGDVDILSIAAGDNNIGNVDVVTLPSIPAGTNNIGDVDVLTLPAVTIAAAQTLANVTTLGTITNTVPTKEVRSATPTQSSPLVTVASTVILASNANRLGATIYNEGTAICYMKLGGTASVTSYSVQIAVGGYYEVPFGYTGAIDGITSASTAQLRVTELAT